jgi:dipeptide/tripeptide permease
VGGFWAPIVTPWISTLYGWPFGVSLGSVFCLIAVVLFFWIDPTERCAEDA